MEAIQFNSLADPDLVYTINYTSTISNRHMIYCAIPCQIQDTYEDLDVISVRWRNLRKGKKGGFFPSGMIVDFWLDGKARHTKVNQTGAIQMTGVPSQAMAEKIANSLAVILGGANDYINSTVESKRFRRATDWLIDNSEGEQFDCINTFTLKADAELGNMEFCKIVVENRIQWPQDIPAEHADILEYFKVLCDDLLSNNNACHVALVSRIKMFTSGTKCNNTYVIDRIRLCNAVYRYNLGYFLDRYKFADCLAALQYDVHYPSSSITEVVVYMTIHNVIATFRFYPKGAVNLNCVNLKIAKQAYDIIMADIVCNRCMFELGVV